MVVVPKRDGGPRRTVDYQKLNANFLRETHHTHTPFNLVSGIPQFTFKTVADAHNGFHQSKLDTPSSKLTTFVTPWGRYRYKRTPMGLCSSTDAYTRRFDDAIEHIPRKLKCVDDVLLYSHSVESALQQAYQFLKTCEEKGITLNPNKFKFCRREVEFVGYNVGWESYGPTEERLAAIKTFNMPEKPTITDIRSWYGLVNQLAPFLATAPVMAPFRDLLKKSANKQVYWDDHLQQKFEESKKVLCQLAKDGLAYFDCARPTMAVTDWSKDGIGFIVMQQYCQCNSVDTPFCCKDGWRLALCGSRQLTSTEANYAPVEGEAMAVVWCLKKAKLFLLGCPNLTIITDHKPLVKLFGDKELKDIQNPRLLAMKEKTLIYSFQMKYLPGKKNPADHLSRYPALKSQPEEADEDLAAHIEEITIAAVIDTLHSEQIALKDEDIQSIAAEDAVYQMLVSKVKDGSWTTSKAQEPTCLRPFYNVRDRLSIADNLVIYTYEQGPARIVIPEALRNKVAANLHASHQGLDSMQRRARQTVYWPGIEGDLEHCRSSCTACTNSAPSQPAETPIMTPPPEYPFQQTAADLCQIRGANYLVYVDRLTGWLEVAHLHGDTTSSELIKHFRLYFARYGVPMEIAIDGGTNLNSEEITTFFKKWGVNTRVSSAYFSQSNGRAEAGVKTAKRILMDNTGPRGSLNTDKVAVALLQYHNTPLKGVNKSPAQLATGRQLRDSVPANKRHYNVSKNWRKDLMERERAMANNNRKIMEKYESSKDLPPITVGTQVHIQNHANNRWDRTGTVKEVLPFRQYTVRMDGSGRLTKRNRRHLKKVSQPGTAEATLDDPSEAHREPRPSRERRRPNRFIPNHPKSSRAGLYP